MSDIYSLDFETYSEADLRNYGAYRYACDSSTEILIFAIAKNDGPVVVWDVLDSFGENEDAFWLLRDAVEDGAPIYAHNAQFEAAVCKYNFRQICDLPPPALFQWRCTAAMCRRAAIPSSLEQAGEFLGIDMQKDKAGKSLIRKFSIPRRPTKNDLRTRIRPKDDPKAFREFGEYCRQDVEAEREIHKVLSPFELTGSVLDAFQFDMRMNDRGVPVNVEALTKVDKLINEYTDRMTERFRDLTNLNPTQTGKVLEWLQERGYPHDNLQSKNVDEVIESPPEGMTPDAIEALSVRSRVSYAAVKKVPTMLNAACPDGRVRGALLWSGAERTHRWAGRIIQPQNFRRPTFKGTEGAYKLLCEGADIDTIEMLYAPFLEVVASCIRHFIQWPEGDLLQADFASVEARAAPWLCGGEKKLELFRQGAPIYETMASKIFGIPVEGVDSEKRFVGKQAELGCTYNMGRPKFRGTCEGFGYTPSKEMVEEYKIKFSAELTSLFHTCSVGQPWRDFEMKFPHYKWSRLKNGKHGPEFSVWAYQKNGHARRIKDPYNPTEEEWIDLTYDNLADRAVTTWRQENPEIVQAWKDIDIAAKKAIQNHGKVFKGTDKISFGYTNKPGFKALVMKLPGGHSLIYPKPKLVWKGEDGVDKDPEDYYNIEIQFWGKVPMKSTWGWCKTYGGKLLENATQGVCGDFMAHGALNADRGGYDALMLVHDEIIATKKNGQTHKELCNLICDLPDWAEGMPLAAEGDTIPFYKK